MVILGLSGGHDANWSVWRDGELVAAFEKERFTRIRHDRGDVTPFLLPTLASVGVHPQDIDMVATSEPVALGEGPGHERVGGRRYECLDDWQWQSVKLFDRIYPALSVPHHLCHAAYARYTCPAPEAAVITMDGGGDQYTVNATASTTVSSWTGRQLDWIQRVDFTDMGSLWASYANAVFGSGHSEGKLMGLAAYGSKRLIEKMRHSVVVPGLGPFAGTSVIKDCWPDYRRPPLLPHGADWEQPRAADAARAVQVVTNETAVSLGRHAREMTAKPYLCLSGGVALNGYMVDQLIRHAGFDDTYVSPAVNDGGIAAGAALFAGHHELGTPYIPAESITPFLGATYSQTATRDALTASGRPFDAASIDDAIGAAASALANGSVVAWYEGRSEHGSRALGNRSILASPRSESVRDFLNNRVKFREAFRPVAPVVLADRAATYFDIDRPSPYMMRIVESRAITRAVAPAVVHRDGTARVQTVATDTSLGRIVAEFDRLTGVPLLVNTSLNVRTPIVETPHDAAQVVARSPIDFSYVNGFVSRS